jgi:hypothetical protein
MMDDSLVCVANTASSAGTDSRDNSPVFPSHPHLSHTAEPGHSIGPAIQHSNETLITTWLLHSILAMQSYNHLTRT